MPQCSRCTCWESTIAALDIHRAANHDMSAYARHARAPEVAALPTDGTVQPCVYLLPAGSYYRWQEGQWQAVTL